MYIPERDLLIYLLKQDYFKSYFDSIDLNHIKDAHRELHYLYLAIKSLHEEFPGVDHELGSFKAYFFAKYPDCDPELYSGLFESLQEATLDPTVGVGILKQMKQRQEALNLSQELVKYATGYGDVEKVNDRIEFWRSAYEAVDEADDTTVVSDDLEELLAASVQKPGLRWRLNCLNKSLGSLRKGDFGFLFARPETGKTTFLASEISHMLENLSDDVDSPVLWINMEEQGSKVMLRVYQAFFGITLQQLAVNPRKWKKLFQDKVQGRLRMIDDAGIRRQDIDKLCKRYKPCLILEDQTSKIKGFSADREDLKLGAAFQWSRELAKEYCPVIGVHQADGSAENVKWLTMEHVANVKTAAQAEADWILGIGAIHAEGAEHTRYLNISKNKLLGDPDSLPDLRHGRMEVYMEPQIARYQDIVKYD